MLLFPQMRHAKNVFIVIWKLANSTKPWQKPLGGYEHANCKTFARMFWKTHIMEGCFILANQAASEYTSAPKSCACRVVLTKQTKHWGGFYEDCALGKSSESVFPTDKHFFYLFLTRVVHLSLAERWSSENRIKRARNKKKHPLHCEQCFFYYLMSIIKFINDTTVNSRPALFALRFLQFSHFQGSCSCCFHAVDQWTSKTGSLKWLDSSYCCATSRTNLVFQLKYKARSCEKKCIALWTPCWNVYFLN